MVLIPQVVSCPPAFMKGTMEDNLKQFGKMTIKVYDSPTDDKRGKVRIFVGEHEENKEFKMFMMSAEFLMHLVAQKSNAGYEQALELLRKGAMTYKTTERPDLLDKTKGGEN